MCSRTSSTNGGAIHLNHSLKGSVSNNSITCSAVPMHPISFGSKEKILWCSINIHSNFRANSGGHSFNLSSRPSFLSNSSSSFYLSSIVNFFGGSQLGSSSSSSFKNSGEGAASGTAFAATTLATGLLAAKCTGLPMRLRRTTETLRLPSHSSV